MGERLLHLGSVFKQNGSREFSVVTSVGQVGYFFASDIINYGQGNESLSFAGTEPDIEFTNEVDRWTIERLIEAAIKAYDPAERQNKREFVTQIFKERAKNSARKI